MYEETVYCSWWRQQQQKTMIMMTTTTVDDVVVAVPVLPCVAFIGVAVLLALVVDAVNMPITCSSPLSAVVILEVPSKRPWEPTPCTAEDPCDGWWFSQVSHNPKLILPEASCSCSHVTSSVAAFTRILHPFKIQPVEEVTATISMTTGSEQPADWNPALITMVLSNLVIYLQVPPFPAANPAGIPGARHGTRFRYNCSTRRYCWISGRDTGGLSLATARRTLGAADELLRLMMANLYHA